MNTGSSICGLAIAMSIPNNEKNAIKAVGIARM